MLAYCSKLVLSWDFFFLLFWSVGSVCMSIPDLQLLATLGAAKNEFFFLGKS